MTLLCRSELFRTLIRQPVEFFDTAEVGVLTSRIGADCQAVVRCLSTNLNVALRNGLQCLGMPNPTSGCIIALYGCASYAITVLIGRDMSFRTCGPQA